MEGERSEEGRALAVARAVAAEHGVACEDAEVLSAGSNVLVHLRPSPVVARVMTGTVALHDDPERWLRREVGVTEFLAPTGLAVRPSPLIAPGPIERDGLRMTFVELVEGRDTMSLGERFAALHETLFASSLPAQAIHGDASIGNLLRTPGGLLWNDFEDTFRGPVEWDVSGYLISLGWRGADDAFVDRALDAYGGLDREDLAPFTAGHETYDDIWAAYDAQRRR